ncbi:MAG: hypothetical protein JW797_11430 [Bradymonadales bacterium]|nr:hypothetical protein [Bradymonadales bacterium]
MDQLIGLVRGEPPAGRLGQMALVIYTMACVASAAWAFSGTSSLPQTTGAAIRWHQEDLAAPAMILSNESRQDWSHLQIILDERYYHDLASLERGRTVLIPLDHFRDNQIVPRPPGLFPYEHLAGWRRSGQEDRPALGYRPTSAEIRTDQGIFHPPLQGR